MRINRLGSDTLRVAAVALLLGLPEASAAQGSSSAQGTEIRGVVVEARTHRPLAGASVLLEPFEAGLISAGREQASLLAARAEVSDEAGVYTFEGLAPGAYVLRVERIGYHGRSVRVQLGPSGSPSLQVGLEVEPIALRPIHVEAHADPSTVPPTSGPASLTAAEQRHDALRARFLALDAQYVAPKDVQAAASLGEADLFRTLQTLPGVSTRDEYAAELWTRGSPWGQTRVYLDDLPLFDPFLGGGALTAIGPAAVGGIFFLPGARPASVGEGAAGVARIATRPAREREGLPLLAELGIGTVQATTERRFGNGRAGVLASGRRSWYDRIWNTFVEDGHDPEGPFDYVARSSLFRFDWAMGEETALLLTRFRAQDRVLGNVAAVATGAAGHWGNGTDQATLSTRVASRQVRLFVGQSRHEGTIEAAPEVFRSGVDSRVVVLRPSRLRLRYRTLGLELGPSANAGRITTRGGLELTRQNLSAAGGASAQSVGQEPALRQVSPALMFGSAWAEARAVPADHIEVQVGLRLDVGGSLQDLPLLRPAPHVAVRVDAADNTKFSVGMRRSYQYLQQVGAAGTPFAGGHSLGHTWTLAGPHTPALRADISTLGVEHRVGAGWLVSGTAWLRRSTGVALEDPTPGTAPIEPTRWVEGESRAYGAELQARRLVGPVTTQLSYSIQRATDESPEGAFASPTARTHGVNALLSVRKSSGLAFGGALTAYTGVPYTRIVSHSCGEGPEPASVCAGPMATRTRGAASAFTGPAYASLDLSMDWTGGSEVWGWGLTVQLRNVLGFENEGGYRGTDCQPGLGAFACIESPATKDRFQSQIGGPFPLVTARIWF